MTEEMRTWRMALRDWVIRMGGDYDALLAQSQREKENTE
jgi:hypothetical protein